MNMNADVSQSGFDSVPKVILLKSDDCACMRDGSFNLLTAALFALIKKSWVAN